MRLFLIAMLICTQANAQYAPAPTVCDEACQLDQLNHKLEELKKEVEQAQRTAEEARAAANAGGGI